VTCHVCLFITTKGHPPNMCLPPITSLPRTLDDECHCIFLDIIRTFLDYVRCLSECHVYIPKVMTMNLSSPLHTFEALPMIDLQLVVMVNYLRHDVGDPNIKVKSLGAISFDLWPTHRGWYSTWSISFNSFLHSNELSSPLSYYVLGKPSMYCLASPKFTCFSTQLHSSLFCFQCFLFDGACHCYFVDIIHTYMECVWCLSECHVVMVNCLTHNVGDHNITLKSLGAISFELWPANKGWYWTYHNMLNPQYYGYLNHLGLYSIMFNSFLHSSEFFSPLSYYILGKPSTYCLAYP